MTALTPLASALHSKVWPLVAKQCAEQCETMDAENAFMNEAVAAYAPSLLEHPSSPRADLGCASKGRDSLAQRGAYRMREQRDERGAGLTWDGSSGR